MICVTITQYLRFPVKVQRPVSCRVFQCVKRATFHLCSCDLCSQYQLSTFSTQGTSFHVIAFSNLETKEPQTLKTISYLKVKDVPMCTCIVVEIQDRPFYVVLHNSNTHPGIKNLFSAYLNMKCLE